MIGVELDRLRLLLVGGAPPIAIGAFVFEAR